MDLIYCTPSGEDIGYFIEDIDIDIGSEGTYNNFETESELLSSGSILYEEGTENGGIVDYVYLNNDPEDKPVIRGTCWRGMLMKDIICPPSGSDYFIISNMEANAAIARVMQGRFGGFFHVSTENSGITISRYQFKLYCTVGQGLMDMLKEFDAKLSIYARKTPGHPVEIWLEAKPAVRVDTYNEDSGISYDLEMDDGGINHLICMGKGELQARMRVDLYLQFDGTIGTTKQYSGKNERTALYDYSGAESEQDLIDNGKKRLLEICGGWKSKLAGFEPKNEYQVGDIVPTATVTGGKIQDTYITRKIIKIKNGTVSYEYRMEE